MCTNTYSITCISAPPSFLHLNKYIKQEPQGALIAHLSTMSTSVKS